MQLDKNYVPVTTGVPQGPVLESVFFFIFINVNSQTAIVLCIYIEGEFYKLD